jgi:hypothetical protein
MTLLLVLGVIGAHRYGGPVFTAKVWQEPGWESFKQRYGTAEYGDDGYFVRAVKSGFNLFFYTDRYGWRFTRKQAADPVNSCAGCHSPEQMAYAFVAADRYDPQLGRRVSFEERVMRCYASASRLDGFVPTLYDPAIRDLRIFARLVAHSLGLSEGELRSAR